MEKVTVGSKCAVLLPQEVINPQKTPAKGIVLDEEIDRALVLVEEVWQFKRTGQPYMSRDIDGSLRTLGWGWQEVPEFSWERIVYKPYHGRVREPTTLTLTKMIQESIEDFLYWRRK